MRQLRKINYTEILFLALALVLPLSGSLSTIFWMLLFFFTLIKFIKNPDFSIFKDKLHYPLYAFIFLTILSIIFAINPAESAKEFKKIGQLFIMFIFIYQMKDNLVLNKKFVKYLFIGLAIAGCFGLFQYILRINEYSNQIRFVPEYLKWLPNNFLEALALNNGRIQGTQSFHLTYAELISSGFCFLLPLYFYKVYDKNNFRLISRIKTGILLSAISFAIVFTYSRGVWLGISIVFLFWFLFYRLFRQKFLKILLLLGILLIVFLKFFPPKGTVIVRLKQMSFSQNSDRVGMWKTGFNIIKEHPVLGIGPKCMIFVYDFFKIPNSVLNQGHVHSSYIQIAAERGVLTSIFFMLMLFMYWLFFMKNYYKSRDDYVKYISLGGAGFLIVFVIFNLTEYAFADNEVAMMFWSILGCGIAAKGNFV